MALTVAALKMSSMNSQLCTLALLILDIQELIERGSDLQAQFCTSFEQADRDDLKMYVSSAETIFGQVEAIREADLLQIWDGRRSSKLRTMIYSLGPMLQRMARQFELRLLAWLER